MVPNFLTTNLAGIRQKVIEVQLPDDFKVGEAWLNFENQFLSQNDAFVQYCE